MLHRGCNIAALNAKDVCVLLLLYLQLSLPLSARLPGVMQMQRTLVLLAVSLSLAAAQPFLGGQNLLPGGTLCLRSCSSRKDALR